MAACFSEVGRSSKSVMSDLLSDVVERRLEKTLLKLDGTRGIVTLVHDEQGKMAEENEVGGMRSGLISSQAGNDLNEGGPSSRFTIHRLRGGIQGLGQIKCFHSLTSMHLDACLSSLPDVCSPNMVMGNGLAPGQNSADRTPAQSMHVSRVSAAVSVDAVHTFGPTCCRLAETVALVHTRRGAENETRDMNKVFDLQPHRPVKPCKVLNIYVKVAETSKRPLTEDRDSTRKDGPQITEGRVCFEATQEHSCLRSIPSRPASRTITRPNLPLELSVMLPRV